MKKVVLFALIAVLVGGTGAFAASWDILISADAGTIITSKDGAMVHDYTPDVDKKKGEVNIRMTKGETFEACAAPSFAKQFYWILKTDTENRELRDRGTKEVQVSTDTYVGWLDYTTTIHATSSDGALFDYKDANHSHLGADNFHYFSVTPKGNTSFWITFTPEIQSNVRAISLDNRLYPLSVMNTSKDMAITFKFTFEAPPAPPKPISPDKGKELVKSTDITLDDKGKVNLDTIKPTGTSFDKASAVAIPMFQAATTGGVVEGISADLSAKMPGVTSADFGVDAALFKVLASGHPQKLTKVATPGGEGQYSVSGTDKEMKFNVWIDDRTGGGAMTDKILSFDFDGTAGIVADPLVVSFTKPEHNKSGGGCSAVHFAPFALFALVPFVLRKKK